jgi:uncharacterized protein (TIGR02996 family)
VAGRDAFERAIDDAIRADDVTTVAAARLVYADWLDEQGDLADARLAVAQRWMAGASKWPEINAASLRRPRSSDWYRERSGAWQDKAHALLPAHIHEEVIRISAHVEPKTALGPGSDYVEFDSRRDAEAALADALAALAPDGGP